jgi:hypothetical protein
MLTRIISGGQTGVDRAALDAAIDLGIPHGGWCPRGRRAEDGRIPDRYQLVELPTPAYPARMRCNVDKADATLILSTRWPLDGGTLATRLYAERPFAAGGKGIGTVYACDPTMTDPADVARWVDQFEIVNIAGPRESKCPGIHAAALAFLLEVLRP